MDIVIQPIFQSVHVRSYLLHVHSVYVLSVHVRSVRWKVLSMYLFNLLSFHYPSFYVRFTSIHHLLYRIYVR